MNNTILIGLASIVALAGTTVYWRRRERMVRESLTVSRDWETNTTNTIEQEDRHAAKKAARELDTTVPKLPERITALDEERRDLRRERDAVRERWADAWWASQTSALTAGDEPNVLCVAFDRWELPDARAFAKRALDEDAITLVVARGDASFAVAVGDPLVGTFSADEISDEIVEQAGGGAGGNDRLAAGGGATAPLDEACQRVKTEMSRSQTVRVVGVEDDNEP